MLLSPLVTLVCLAAPPQAPLVIAPIVGEDIAAVIHVDLARLDVPSVVRRVLGGTLQEGDLREASKVAARSIDPLKQAGAREIYILIDPADMPGLPVFAVPVPDGADAAAIAAQLRDGLRQGTRPPAVETIRGVIVVGTEAAVARIKAAKPSTRPDLAAALAGAGDGPIRLAIVPSETLRRSVEESVPSLPPQLGGGPIGTLTRGMSWAAASLVVEPKPALRLVVSARDEASAVALQKIAVGGLKLATAVIRQDPTTAPLATAVAQMKPVAKGDRVTLEADLEPASALVAVPLGQARAAARRSRSVNNMKQLGLAMHNYLSDHKDTFPPAYSVDKAGKPLLSWRVHVLPFLDEKALYDQFKLDEPWDSVHNKALISRMPKVYASADTPLSAEGKTTYLTPRGPATMFPGAEGVKIGDITDGTSNTVMVVEAADGAAVVWTKPDDWSAGAGMDPATLFGRYPGGTNMGFADGSVRFVKQTITAKLLGALLSSKGGEVISADDY